MMVGALDKWIIIISLCLLQIPYACSDLFAQPAPDYADQPLCTIKRVYLGTEVRPAHPGLEVLKVFPNGTANKADIRIGDILMSINQSPVNKRADIRAIVETIQSDAPITIVLKRNSEDITKTIVPVTIEAGHIMNAIDKIVYDQEKKVNLMIIVDQITNTADPVSLIDEWKKGTAPNLGGQVEGAYLLRYRNIGRFSIIARNDTEKLLNELKIQEAGIVTGLVKSGRMIGATHLLVIDVNRSPTASGRVSDSIVQRLIDIESGTTIAIEKCDSILK